MLELLRTFQLVAHHRSFTRAAQESGLTRPAVSQQIKQLEQHFGVTLFARNTRQVQLTPAGEELLRHVRKVLQAVSDMEAAIAAVRRQAGRLLTIGASTLPGETLLPRALARFRQQSPDTEVSIRVGNSDSVLAMLRAGEVDLALVGRTPVDPALISEAIAHDRVVLVLPPGWPPVPDPLPLTELSRLPLVLRESGSATRALVMEALQAQGFRLSDLQVVAELGSPEAVKTAVRSGAGAAFFSTLALSPGELPAVRLEGVDLTRPVCACWRDDKPLSEAARTLVALLAAAASHHFGNED